MGKKGGNKRSMERGGREWEGGRKKGERERESERERLRRNFPQDVFVK